MTVISLRRPHPAPRRARVVAIAAVALVASSVSVFGADPTGDAQERARHELPPGARSVMESQPYQHARWSWHAVDLGSGDEEILSNGADLLTLLGSTTKLITVGTFYDRIGPDATVTTSVYGLGDSEDGVLGGDLILVGAGDFILGSRAVTDVDVDFEEPDHVYYYVGPITIPVEADPLAGLDDLASQVAASGITSIEGDVLVDDRLWDPYVSKEGLVTPTVVNDNLLDIRITPGASVGDAATLEVRPETAFFDVVNDVMTVEAGDTVDIGAEAGDGDQVVVGGSIAADHDPVWTSYFAPDPTAYARALFVEALQRAGVSVDTPLEAAVSALPDEGSYADGDRVASLESPPAHVLGRLILKVSHNRGAETFMCLLAVSAGSKDCAAGVDLMLDTVAEVGIPDAAVFLVDGEGSDPSAATPRAMTQWLAWAIGQPWADVYRDGMPTVGDQGAIDSKSGTSAGVQPTTGRLIILTKSEAGYMETDDGLAAITLFANNGIFDNVVEGALQATQDLADVLIAIQQG